jgi:hypothetical protein
MATKDCPHCRLANPLEAQRCDCGYDFTSHEMEPSYLRPKVFRSINGGILVAGAVLFGLCVLCLFSFFFSACGAVLRTG